MNILKIHLSRRTVCVAVLLLVFCFSAAMLARDLYTARREAAAFEALARQVEADSAGESRESGSAARFVPPEQEERSPYEAIYQLNPDFFAWVSIPDTKLNYPVMYSPEEPERYLHRAFDGSYSASGVPFLDGACFPGCGNYLLYGHNMKNGTMFAPLLSYAKEDFWREHPVIRLGGLEGVAEYEVVAAFYSRLYSVEDTGVFRYYTATDLREETDFQAYLDQVARAALYDTGVTASWGDQLLTLSTCSYHTRNGRFVVVARLQGEETEGLPAVP